MADKEIAVKVLDLSKSFKIPLEASSGVKQKLINLLKGRKGYREFTPLNDISFEIKKGDFFGIVGRNGSGKSTLLKTIAGIYAPNNGLVQVNGTLVPFIELGVGFNPELTGRENVFLNGALLGFSREEMEAMYDKIVEFAELEEFMEERLKNYSTGMQVRLAFSIAIRAEGDILLLDEVLAVGDEAFQRKCFAYFERLKRNKKTVILVTHDMSSVERYCNKALMISDGEIEIIGDPNQVAAAYSRSNDESYDPDTGNEVKGKIDDPADIYNLKIRVESADTLQEKKKFISGEEMIVGLTWKNPDITEASITIVKESGETVFGVGTYQDKYKMGKNERVSFRIKLDINEGDYYLKVGLGKKGQPLPVVMIDEGPRFTVNRDKQAPRWEGFSLLDHSWGD